ncbi:acetyl-CoA carboxylase biotin carboxyl carrier protein subunit [Desulfoscipio geothermicus]|uniref:Biotin-requiring enzyme n=1 Tax=Desulfoscipio geothermicus DSM 3669 TaxID=1121426 RepID=A0A1I6CQ75_9FIRM|nr:acetyl-CoA carboxylase biotin carboxyl carrier protein subunit [Desulfoscipio geothermicus]SFQ95303.1 Biotin-requiring enzyme [Desulfoscipio geothermicus DSM 3669]
MQVKAPMVGKLVSIDVNVGDKVNENDTLATLEAMKMIIKIFAPSDGEIKEILSSPGAVVDPDTPIVTLV